jgi:glycerol-3-phosphate cytidylyltransferase
MLEEAKGHCDRLIVGLQSDPTLDRPEKNKPIQTLEERLTMLNSIRWVDDIIIYNTEAELVRLLNTLRPDVRIIGADWKGKQYTGFDLPIRVIFNTRDHGYSTSSLRSRVYRAEKDRQSL